MPVSPFPFVEPMCPQKSNYQILTPEGVNMSYNEQIGRLHDELERLYSLKNWTNSQRARVQVVHEEILDLEARQREDERAKLRQAFRSGSVELEDGAERGRSTGPTLWKQRSVFEPARGYESDHEVFERALSAVERWHASDELKEGATRTLESTGLNNSDPGGQRRGVAEHILRYSDPAYLSAFGKYLRHPEDYLVDLTPEEARVWRASRDHQQRAALDTTGAVLPAPLDPAINLVNAGDVDPVRRVSRIQSTVSKSNRFITSDGSTFSFDAELAEVSDDTPTLNEVEVETHKAQGFVQASIEAAEDQPGFIDKEIAKIIADGKARLEAVKFVKGAGDASNEPYGIVTRLTGTASEVNAIGEGVDPDDVYGLLEALPPRFRPNARWQLELSTLNYLHRLWNPTGEEPPLVEDQNLVRRSYDENSNLDPWSAVNTAANGTHRLLVVGDWTNYVVLDRIGTTVSYLPPGVLQGSNRRPDGRVGWYVYWRVGADVLTTNAFRLLKITTTA